MGPTGKDKERILADLAMLLAAVIWGGGFVAQRQATDHLDFFAYNALRFLLAGLVILPLAIKRLNLNKESILWILLSGGALFIGSALQQAGLQTTTAASAGFITGLYVVLVPLFLAIFWRLKIPALNWLAALAALVGTYLLSTSGKGFNISTGDLLELAGAFVWPFHVIIVGFAAKKLNPFVLSAGQSLVCGLLNLGFSFFFQPITSAATLATIWPILYGGIFSVAGGFTLQTLGQSKAPTADSALILSLESVFAAIFGVLLLGEKMNPIQILGSVIIMTSIFGVQFYSIWQGHKASRQINAN
jgi:drug/metabolite transporter (DMT)-like permease